MSLFIKFMTCFSVFVVLFGHSSQALTTFGKTNTQSPPPPQPTVKARDCQTESQCSGIQDTSCVRDHADGHTKCLCGDNAAPVNGACQTKLKGLRHACSETNKCMEEMICVAVNNTQGPDAMVITTGATKVCVCNKEEGYIEIDHECSGSPQSTAGLLVLLSGILSLKILQ